MIAAALAYWTHDLDPVAIHFPENWGLRGVHWYGLSYAAGFMVAAYLLGRWRRAGITPLRDVLAESTLITAVNSSGNLHPAASAMPPPFDTPTDSTERGDSPAVRTAAIAAAV
jgi:hypothetical protein